MIASGIDPKADDSCVGRCGQSGVDSTKSCQCNVACSNFGDCCSNYVATCNSCQGRCNDAFDNKWPCQCNTANGTNNDCCPDYSTLCTGGKLYKSLKNLITILKFKIYTNYCRSCRCH